jgi:hypothetical protein
MVIVKLEGFPRMGGGEESVGCHFTTEDLSPETELAEIFRKLDLEGEFVTFKDDCYTLEL